MKETEKKVVNPEDSRIDTALENKPFNQCFVLIKRYPEILTLERLEKFIRRCAKNDDAKSKMRDFLNDRFDSHGRWHNPNKDYDLLWNHAIVLAMIECYYFEDDYDYDKLIYLVKKFDDGNALRLGYKWFKNSGYAYNYDSLEKLKDCFTPEYVQERLKEGRYREILTLVSLKAFELPKNLTNRQKEKFQKHVFEVIMANYNEENISAANDYHKDRLKRIETLFEQCPALFTVKNIVAVALNSHDLAKRIYNNIPKEQRKISQTTISELLDDKRRCEKMIVLVFLCHIRLNAANRERVYVWVKKTMSSNRLIDGGYHGSECRTADLLEDLIKKRKITLSFDDFLDALIEIGDKKDWDIEGYNEKKFMNKYFSDYKKYLSIHCNYSYRSGLESKQKKQIIMDFFFWKYLPWRMLDDKEKIAINRHVQMRAEKYPRQALLLARKYPKIVRLTNKSKLKIFDELARRGDKNDKYKFRYVNFNFGSSIDNDIILSAKEFKNLARENMDKSYTMIQISQIKINKVPILTKFKLWWYKSLYMLILIQKNNYMPTEQEVVAILKDFSDDRVNYYFVPAWNILPEISRPTISRLCMWSEKSSNNDPNFEILIQVLKKKLVVLDYQLINTLMDMYNNQDNQSRIKQIAKLKIPNVSELSIRIDNYTLESILE